MAKRKGTVPGSLRVGFTLDDTFLADFAANLDKKLFMAGLTTVYPGMKIAGGDAETGQMGVTFGDISAGGGVINGEFYLDDSDVIIKNDRHEDTGDGTTTAFTFNHTGYKIFDSESVDVYDNGILQEYDNYGVTINDGSTVITFTTAPISGNPVMFIIPRLMFRT